MAFEKLEKEKQNKIINAACEVFARHGYKKASMKDIAETAGISKSVLFKYFSTKQNLYMKVFRLASDSISEADTLARAEGELDSDTFSLMRRSAKNRLSLFKEFPWIYKFSYTAAFDGDLFVRELVKRELENYRQANTNDGLIDHQSVADDLNGLRNDIPLDIIKQIIYWISQGYLEERLYRDDIDPDGLEQGFEKWIDVLEILLKSNNIIVAEKGTETGENMNETMTMQEIIGGVESVPGLKHKTLQVCGGPMSVYEAGDHDRPVVVMLHGAMYDESRFIWDQMFPFLSGDYHLFALDTPRHGKSRPWQGYMDRPRLMDILDNTFSQLGLESISLVGLSMGGGLSIEYASLHPEKVRSMVLFEPGGLGDKVDMELITWLYIKFPGMLRLLSRQYIKRDHKAMGKTLRSIYVGGSKPTDPDRLIAILEDEVKGKYQYGENDMDDWQLSGIGPFRVKWNFLNRIPLIKCPTLWLRGADSLMVKQHEMERAVNLALDAGMQTEFKLIPNAGHIMPLERPEQVNVIVKEYLDKTTG